MSIKLSLLIALFILYLPRPAKAADVEETYVVWAASITPAQRTTLRNYGRNQDRQPMFITRWKQGATPDYWVISLVVKNQTERDFIDNAVAAGKAYLIRKSWLVTDGDRVRRELEYVNEEPKQYIVEVSTP